jgi:D-alanine-D-alanine ligase
MQRVMEPRRRWRARPSGKADHRVTIPVRPRIIPEEAKRRLRIMFVAKHALWDGGLHPDDGNHALYHVETREILKSLGFDLVVESRYSALFEEQDVDFVFPLLNRGGFLNSEMMLPLLCTRLGLPYLGASPIMRGLADDKHLTKMAAAARGVPTAPWAVYRRGAPVDLSRCPAGDRLVIKPNASSASWGVRDAHDWAAAAAAIAAIHAEGHDAIVEPFLNGSDVEVPVITIDGEPVVMPMMLFEQADPTHLRTYWEKRDLVDRGGKYRLVPFDDPEWTGRIADLTLRMAGEYRPFDYGRFEFRIDCETGTLNFLEVNLQANLWSEKVFGCSAARAGMSQAQLIETILYEGLRRHGLLEPAARPAPARRASFTVAILAAQRDGRLDPLAARAGVSHKCLVPIAGKPLLAHVLAAVRGIEGVARIRIVVEESAVERLGAIAAAEVEAGVSVPIEFVSSADNLTDSVYAAAEGVDGPIVVTTADNVLLTPGAVAEVAGRLGSGCDVIVALAKREDVLAAHPEGQRRFYRFRDAAYSNCNLYGFSRRGLRMAETFRQGGQFSKYPGRVVRSFGILNLLILRFGILSLERAMRRLSRRFGVAARALVLSDGAHAIDVDNERTYSIAEQLLRERDAIDH